jgi:glucose/arabinose dehydrogenase
MTDLVKFPAAIAAKWSSGCPTVAPSGAGFVSTEQWSAWNGSLAVAVLKDQRVMFLRLDLAGDVVERNDRITDRGRLRSAIEGPEGDLYVSQDAFPGSILRIHPVL